MKKKKESPAFIPFLSLIVLAHPDVLALLFLACRFFGNEYITEKIAELRPIGASLILPLPKNGNWDYLERLGIKINQDSKDELFYETRLPPLWSLKPTNHDKYTFLLDERGLIRAEIFFRGLYYNRQASINAFSERFELIKNNHSDRFVESYSLFDLGTKTVVKQSEIIRYGFYDDTIPGVLIGQDFYYAPEKKFLLFGKTVFKQTITHANFNFRKLTHKERGKVDFQKFNEIKPVAQNHVQKPLINYLDSLKKNTPDWSNNQWSINTIRLSSTTPVQEELRIKN